MPDYTISPDYSIPTWNVSYAYVVKDAATGAILASWRRTATWGLSVSTWYFHDPLNLINVQIGTNGYPTGWTFN